MSQANRDLTANALALPEEERLALASELIDSIEGHAEPDWEKAWHAELQRRSAAPGKQRPWKQVRASLLQRLSDR
jgi:putative addiction module component (TIGR02574 family)